MPDTVPVIVFAYNRLAHLKTTISSLSETLEVETVDLIIFSDGAQHSQSDRQKVAKVRNYLSNLSGPFHSIKVVYRPTNFGLSENVISGVDEVLARNEYAIILEDDIIVSLDFVDTMKRLLKKYKNMPNIGSISGYMYPVEIQNDTEDFFLLPRASSWGWATWSDRWRDVDWSMRDFTSFSKNRDQQKIFNNGGEDLTAMLFKWKYGLNDSWAVRWSYHHFKHDMYCLFPKRSMVLNHGNDGSGTHSPNTARFGLRLQKPDSFTIPQKPECNQEVLHRLQVFFRLSPVRRIINKLQFMYFKLRGSNK